MVVAGINILIIAVLILIIGLINPKWLLVWVEKPGRMPIVMIASVLFMIGMTVFGEGTKQKKEALEKPQVVEKAKEAPSKKVDIVPAQDLLKQ